MKSRKETELKFKYYPCWQEDSVFSGGAEFFWDYQHSIRMDISTDVTDTEIKLYIFGTEKGLYGFGKYLYAEGSWKCWYDHYHQHYDDIRNRYNIPFINLIVNKIQGTDIIKNIKEKIIEKSVKLNLYYHSDWKDEKGVLHYGKVCAPKYTDEIAISIYDDTDTLDDEFDEFFKNGKFQVNLTATDRAMRELGKYLINVSMFKTKNKRYIGTIKNILSNDGKKISICVSKIWKTPKEIEAQNSFNIGDLDSVPLTQRDGDTVLNNICGDD